MADRDAREELEAIFPRLRDSGYVVTSDYEHKYNCVAYIAGDRDHRWEPESRGGWYWPPGLPRGDYSLGNYLRCFERLGFAECDDGTLEEGVEKIAVFIDDDDFSHVAGQLHDGWWTSKLGFYEDISHSALELLLNGRPTKYGEKVMFMSRPRRELGPGRSGLVIPT